MRKKILLFTLLISVFLLDAFSSTKEEKSIKITVRINEEIAQKPQWVYWFSLIGNNYNIEDSLFIHEGQRVFSFEKVIGKDRGFYFTWLTFEKKGPTQNIILAVPGEKLNLEINNNTKNGAKIEGSVFHKEDYANKQLIRKMKDSLSLLQDSLILATEENEIKRLEYRIKEISRYVESESYLDFTLKAESPITATLSYDFLPFKCPDVNLDSLKQVIIKRFPNDKIIDQYFNYKEFPPQTQESKDFYKRYLQLSGIQDASQEPSQRQSSKDIKPYIVGQRIDSLSLKGLDGNNISFNDIKTDYIFIDFWASWCAPCRKEIPYLKKVAEKYPDLITIYAISLDNTEKEWKAAIDIDQSEIFTHVYGGMFTSPETSILLARFGVNAIPANFLLDKDRRIIATNLRGETLMKKMKKLIGD